MANDVFINASKTSNQKTNKKYYGNYLGIVIQNNDPEKAGKVKIWVPHISPTVYTKWNELNTDKSFKFIGKNIDSDITDVVEDLKRILPWAICAAPLNGSSGSGRYNAFEKTGTISDSNNVSDHNFNKDYVKTKYSLNNEGIGEKPGRKYEIQDLKVTDAFTNAGDVPFENGNKYGYNYNPSTYSNAAKGTFGLPNVGSHVWVFFDDGDPTSPIYFAISHGQEDWKSIYDNSDNSGIDYPGSSENKNSDIQNYNHNTETYRNKYVINQKGGSFEIVNTDNREALKLTHHSGSFKELNNHVNIEFATNNDQKLVQGDKFTTTKGYNNQYVGRDTDQIFIGDKYTKIGNQKYDIFKEYKELLDPIADAKQLFEVKRASKIETDVGFFKKTSLFQSRDGDFGACPVCTGSNRQRVWDNKYKFTSIKTTDNSVYTYTKNDSDYDFINGVTSTIATIAVLNAVGDKSSFLSKSNSCPVCNGSGLSPSTKNGNWITEDKNTYVIQRLKSIATDLTDLEKKMGRGGNEIITITKNKIENIGLVFNDFPSIRVDSIGKIDIDQVLVFDKGVAATQKERPLHEYVHVDDLPGGSLVQSINNKWNVQVGAGGVSIKTVGGLDIGGSITNIAGQQTNVVAEDEINIDSKVVTIAAEMLILRNKNKKQVVVDGNLGVNQNVVIGGSLHVEGELSVQHITAPVEIQETEPVVVQGTLISGKISYESIGSYKKGDSEITGVGGALFETFPHTHPFKNVPLKLMKSKDDVRKIGKAANEDIRSAAIPVIHEKKSAEEITE
tara:strand:+ start:2013 stop:4367 length:2355 start_codon:yes stop_codon:yes gene_type:complete